MFLIFYWELYQYDFYFDTFLYFLYLELRLGKRRISYSWTELYNWRLQGNVRQKAKRMVESSV